MTTVNSLMLPEITFKIVTDTSLTDVCKAPLGLIIRYCSITPPPIAGYNGPLSLPLPPLSEPEPAFSQFILL